MKKENISILKVKTDKLYQHPSFREKKWKVIADIQIGFHESSIFCELIEGVCKKTDSKFYFIELPCHRFKTKLGKWVKKNLFNFNCKKESDDFQIFSKELLNESYSFLMDGCNELVIVKEDDKKNFKARNKSKFT